ncbi:GtrA family protein [Streptomyces sp. NPDC005251]|uniref:GtrA family protein n=1 Tax=Streptomyces sp. NPDC005251 TaxID=3157166 RepID=UPI0033BC2883
MNTVDEADTKRTELSALLREVVRFGAVGGLGVGVNLAVFNLSRALTSLPVVRCSVIATSVAIVFNYLGFRYFAYRHRASQGRAAEFALFCLFSVVGLIIESGVLYVATYGFGWDSALESNLFKIAGIACATLFRFWSYRTWVFRVRH